MYRTNGSRIEVRKLIGELLIQWRKLLIWLAAGVIAGTGLSIYKTQKLKQPAVSKAVSAADKLTEEQKEEAEELFHEYEQMKDYRQTYAEAMKSDALMQMPYDYMLLTRQYQIDTSLANPAELLNVEYSDEDEKKSAELCGFRNGTSGMQKLTWYSISSIVSSSEVQKSVIATVYVMAPDEDACRGILDLYAGKVSEKAKQSSSEFSMEPIATSVSAGAKADLIDRKNEALQALDEMDSRIASASSPANLSDDVKDYFQALVDDENEIQQTATVSKKKYLVIGTAAGLLLGVLLAALRYILNHNVKSALDLEELGVPVIAVVQAEENKKQGIFSRWGCRLKHEENALPYDDALMIAASEISCRCGGKTVFFAADQNGEKFADDLAAQVGKDCRKGMLGDPKLRTEAIGSDNTVLIVTRDHTLLNHVCEYLAGCKRNGIKVLGCIVQESE